MDDEEEDYSSLPELSPEDMIPPSGEDGVMAPVVLLLPSEDPAGGEELDLLEQNHYCEEEPGPFGFSRRRDAPEEVLPPYGDSRIIGLRVAGSALTYRVNTTLNQLQPGDDVVVETRNGENIARVVFVSTPGEAVAKTLLPGPVTKVVRRWTQQDREERVRRAALEREARIFCKQTIREMKLPMKLSRVLYEGGKAVFFYTADNRIDFRELVRVLARQLHVRVEMRQVGVRDETRMLEGFGPCGKELCCAQFLDKFKPVSVRMAKNQELSLNPDAISGVCGRLMCCLVYENDAYLDLRKRLPKPGTPLMTSDGVEVLVKVVHPLKGVLDVLMPTGEKMPFPLENLRPMPGGEALYVAEVSEAEPDDEEESSSRATQPPPRRMDSVREERGASAPVGEANRRSASPRRGRPGREGGPGEGAGPRGEAAGGRRGGGEPRPPRSGDAPAGQPRTEPRTPSAQGAAGENPGQPRRGGGESRPGSSQPRRERTPGQGQEGRRSAPGEGGEPRRGQPHPPRRERPAQGAGPSGETPSPRSATAPAAGTPGVPPGGATPSEEGGVAQRRRRRRRRGGGGGGPRGGGVPSGGGEE